MADKTVLTDTIENATELTTRIKTLNQIIVQIQNAESSANNSDELKTLKSNLKDAEKQLAVAVKELGSALKIDLDDFKCKTTGQTTGTRECTAVREPSTEGKICDDTGESGYERLAALGQHLDSMDKEEISNEVIENVIGELKIKMKMAEKHNSKLRCKLDEENRRSFKMAKKLRNRTPFSKTKTGEVVFPGKKQMENKIDILTNEIKRLRQEFHKLQMEHCRLELARNAMIAADCPEPLGDEDQRVKIDSIQQLNVFSEKLQDEFYTTLEEISKYRVMLDDTKNELCYNNKQLSNAKAEISEKSKNLTAYKKLTEDTGSMLHVYNKELKDAKNRVEGLEKIIEMQKCEMEAKNEKYMELLQRKELKKIQANELCQERSKREVENEKQFDRVKEYFDKRLESIQIFPIAFQAAKEQLFEQKELKKETDRKIECLNDLLKKIREKKNNMQTDKLKTPEVLIMEAKNAEMKNELKNLEKQLSETEKRGHETKIAVNQLKSDLERIKKESSSKIVVMNKVLKKQMDKYICDIKELQQKISETKAYACSETVQLELVSAKLKEHMDSLESNVEQAKENITDIENTQNYIKFIKRNLCYTTMYGKDLKKDKKCTM